MRDSLLKKYKRQYQFKLFCTHYWAACGALHRKQDLEQLIEWAKRKKLSLPLLHYQRCLVDEEGRLWHYQIHSPWSLHLAQLAIAFNSLLNPPTQKYRKGYASQYK